MSKTFLENLGMDLAKDVENKGGLSYLSWARAIELAGRPGHSVALFNGLPMKEVFGGAAVAVDMDHPNIMNGQRTWLPVLDANNTPAPFQGITSREVNDSLQRCRAKAIAMVTGIGLSLYADFGGDGARFVKELGIDAKTDLATAPVLLNYRDDEKKVPYLHWAIALAAAKITDPVFSWGVSQFSLQTNTAVPESVPYTKVGETFMVAVNVHYKGASHCEFLPVMGVVNGVEFQSLTAPDVFNWNTSVMRCLAKAIAVVSGYGLSVYIGEDTSAMVAGDASMDEWNLGIKNKGTSVKPVNTEAVAEVRALLAANGKDELSLCGWLGIPKQEDADATMLSRAVQVLKQNPVKKAA